MVVVEKEAEGGGGWHEWTDLLCLCQNLPAKGGGTTFPVPQSSLGRMNPERKIVLV
jgi:hypothetical protein